MKNVLFYILVLAFLTSFGQNDSLNFRTQEAGKIKIIDVHIHAPLEPGTLEGESMLKQKYDLIHDMDSLNIVFGILNGLPEFFEPWNKAAPNRFINFIIFPCVDGKAPNFGRECYPNGKSFPDIDWLESEIKLGHINGLGEITAEYIGMSPNDMILEPYWSLAEKYNIPVAIHMGLGPPNAAYSSSPVPYKSPNFRVSAGNPLLLEDVLLKHKNLKVNVMHAGWPMLEEMIYILYAHPNVNVDMGVLSLIPQREYYYYLKRLVDAGFADRIMFGSDGDMTGGIRAILKADFLTQQQKEDILYYNAVKFFNLKLDPN